jgi:hypothetical protein
MYKYVSMETNTNLARTTIVLDTSIRDKLKQYGVKGETYEDIIVKLMKFYDSRVDGRNRPVSIA